MIADTRGRTRGTSRQCALRPRVQRAPSPGGRCEATAAAARRAASASGGAAIGGGWLWDRPDAAWAPAPCAAAAHLARNSNKDRRHCPTDKRAQRPRLCCRLCLKGDGFDQKRKMISRHACLHHTRTSTQTSDRMRKMTNASKHRELQCNRQAPCASHSKNRKLRMARCAKMHSALNHACPSRFS